ncbi:hypothetical protein K435DRAFT_867541 [Dendrothele bispora CBS 962.96]|uniref:Uncharacterized protein n=1 Tax=Dendrothele bispora (strain CBS 962.96) TaxID=1314807 RepID=A0A4S8LDX5_DENBC|nr:hypothetical protein K435DRAFT_867541 [Dendrothele bispora CBS 962.96]
MHLYNYDTFDHRTSIGFGWEQLTELTLAPIFRGEGHTLTLLTASDIFGYFIPCKEPPFLSSLTAGEDAIVQNRTQPAITLPFLHTLDLYLAINLSGVSYANQDDAVHIFNRFNHSQSQDTHDQFLDWCSAIQCPYHLPMFAIPALGQD